MPKRQIPWASIQAEYETLGSSQRVLAEKYGVSKKSVEYHSCRENWTKGRSEYEGSVRVKTSSRVRERLAERAADIAADEINRGLMASEQILAIATEALSDPVQFRRHHFK